MLISSNVRLRILIAVFLSAIAAGHLCAQKPGDADLNDGYKALAAKQYDAAIAAFQKGLSLQPGNFAAHKDLAYALLKTGESAQARDEFEAALKLNGADETAALEYAFLAYETKKPQEARRMFDKLRHSPDAATNTTAEQAFQNIDEPLRTGIKRWQEALSRVPDPRALSTFSAHWELAQLAELGDEWALAAEQYGICRNLKPQLPELLLMLARVWVKSGRTAEAQSALLAASRSKDSRTAELALETMGARYPYPYEFLDALKLDERNIDLRRELAYLYLAMHKEPEATAQFEQILVFDPNNEAVRKQLDALRGIRTRASATDASHSGASAAAQPDAKAMGKKSLAAGYLPDAIRYLQRAHEQDPGDAEVMLQLGWAYNQAKNDTEAIEWFNRARRADDPLVAAEASHAFHNLRGDTLPATTIWAMPMYSSRWKDVFSYGQIKRTIPLPLLGKTNKAISFYVSMRFAGDARGSITQPQTSNPEYLSESSFILGAGVASTTWHHLTAWAEAGEAFKYLPNRHDVGAAIPDYRGGLNFAKGFGSVLGRKESGMFYETTGDAVYIHRFDKDWLFYSQHRAGKTFAMSNGWAGQLLVNANYTRDMKGEAWANTIELGPGLKLRAPWMPPAMYFSTDLLRGFYTNASKPAYNDVRVSLWYAITK